jgi:small multidrug resistance family-3 protein
LVSQGIREHRGWLWVGAGAVALGLYGLVATLQPSADFGRILAAYGRVLIAGSPAWGSVVDGFRPDRWDIAGTLICLVGAALLTYAPRPHRTHPVGTLKYMNRGFNCVFVTIAVTQTSVLRRVTRCPTRPERGSCQFRGRHPPCPRTAMSAFTSLTRSVRLGLFQSRARGETAAETTRGQSPAGDGRGRASIFAESLSFRVGILVPGCEC